MTIYRRHPRHGQSPRSAPGGYRKPRGFTLVELLYVLVILGIVAGIAAPMIDVDRFRLNSAVIEVATELMAAQRSAVLRGHDIIVALDQEENRLRIHQDANNDRTIQDAESWKVFPLPEGVVFGNSGAPKLSQKNPPITFRKKQGELPAITFHRNGSSSEAGVLYITGVGGGATARNTRAVEIIRSTAKVKCWSYQANSWLETC